MSSNSDDNDKTDLRAFPPIAREEKTIEGQYDWILLLISLFIAISVTLGVDATLPGDDTARNFMVLFVGVVAGTLSLAANKSAFYVGAKLASRGDRLAIALCMGWFLLLGGTVGTIGFTGVSHGIVSTADLRKILVAIERAKDSLLASGNRGSGAVAVVAAARSDIESLIACETRRGCISGRTGVGRQVAELRSIAARLRNSERGFSKSQRSRTTLASRLAKLAADYEEQLGESGATPKNRAALLKIYSQARAVLNDLAGQTNAATVTALVSDLRGFRSSNGVGRINLSARLGDHADRIEAALPASETAELALPAFPGPIGVAAGWQHLDKAWPYAVLLFGLELIVIVLWFILVRRFIALREYLAKVEAAEAKASKGNGVIEGDHGPWIGTKRPGRRNNPKSDDRP